MSDRLVTVATFQDHVAASLAMNYLEHEGIRCILIDETTVATDWILSGAIGGVKLQVTALHLERAEMLLEQIDADRNEDAQPLPDSGSTATATQEIADELRAERTDKAPINVLADRAFRTAVCGLLFWPLQFYATYLLISLVTAEGTVSPDRRWKVWTAVFVNIPVTVAILLLMRHFVNGY